MKTKTAAGTFIVCAWNALLDTSTAWIDDSMARCAALFLQTNGWIELKNPEEEKDADLIVIVPRDRDKPMSIEDLAVFHAGLDGEKKK